MKSDLSFKPSNLEEMWCQWLGPLRYHEPSLIVSYPGNDNIRRIDQLINNQAFVQSKLQVNTKIKWIKMDYRIAKWLSIDQLRTEMGTLNENSLTTIILIIGLEAILKDGRSDLISAIQELYRLTNVRVMLVSDNNYYDPVFEKMVLSLLSFQPRLGYLPQYNLAQTSEFVEYLCNKWETKLGEKAKSEIYKHCGGNLGFVKEVVWYLRDNGVDKFEEAVHSQQLLWQIRSWWSKLSESDKNYLRYLAFGHEAKDLETMTKDYLERMAVVDSNGKILGLQILDYILKYETNPKGMGVSGEKILIAGEDYTSYFTDKQRKILKVLIEHKNDVVQRDQLLEMIWGDKSASDWAFDSQINRLRKRLNELGLKSVRLQTRRGRGLIWQE